MKKIFMCVALPAFMLLGFTACGTQPDEVVPMNKRNASDKAYKVPDPEMLTGAEQSEVTVIRNEYYENVPQ